MSKLTKIIHWGKLQDAITDWKAPYEVAAIVGHDGDAKAVRAIEEFLHLLVRLGKAEYSAANNTFRARIQP